MLYLLANCAEVRAAPHMDNLVDAYLHMETALGLNIFASQPTEVRGTQGIAGLLITRPYGARVKPHPNEALISVAVFIYVAIYKKEP